MQGFTAYPEISSSYPMTKELLTGEIDTNIMVLRSQSKCPEGINDEIT